MMIRTTEATAIVLIVAEPGRETEVYNELQAIPEVAEQMLLFGEYDLYVKIICEDYALLGSVVINKIRAIDGVDSTKTLTAASMF
ncbi:MAG: Lrp/AsnC ligand binding domain-containing protein [Candidatus Thalassarchaeaceae archaeon]|jgi:DNA-binding Lrp family transcriptional regulator|nr:Lrp/AsnC ligand binding domain-containing protein [Candidatus Thalassarchaeaceae archaeon]MDP7042949.1 Lrp/AsnC ligand binding domain-containing protein [Candidatus Thalassarchaeaceae archaeon]